MTQGDSDPASRLEASPDPQENKSRGRDIWQRERSISQRQLHLAVFDLAVFDAKEILISNIGSHFNTLKLIQME